MVEIAHLSEDILEQLRNQVASNIDRYQKDGFADQSSDPGWSIMLECDVDLDVLDELDGTTQTAEADLQNTRLLMRGLGGLSPSLANEERIWARLSHIEGFSYSKSRWLNTTDDPQRLAALIHKHFFAPSQTGIRDDHALSRLWWTGFIAQSCYPENPDHALSLIWHSADVRSNLVERIWLTSRKRLIAGVLRIMSSDSRVLKTEQSFREFMKALNVQGSGVVFEIMSDQQVDDFLARCLDISSSQLDS